MNHQKKPDIVAPRFVLRVEERRPKKKRSPRKGITFHLALLAVGGQQDVQEAIVPDTARCLCPPAAMSRDTEEVRADGD